MVDFPSLDPDEFTLIRDTVRSWAEAHPAPDVPVFVLLDGSEMTPPQIADALERPDTPRGRTLHRMFAITLHGDVEQRVSLEELLLDFQLDITEWRRSSRG